ncbi:autolysin, partial [Enterobacter mori]
MTKHKKGSILSIIGLLVILGVAAVIVFSMISDQIFFKDVDEQEKVENLKVSLDKASKKQIDNYTS